jgi:hypothetical protein
MKKYLVLYRSESALSGGSVSDGALHAGAVSGGYGGMAGVA